jgi:pre-mRNA-processing factor 39
MDCRLFERGAKFVGFDFLAHPFWDKYIEYEQRQEGEDRIFQILARIIKIPVHQYARYYERFRGLIHTRPLSELVPPETLTRIQSEVQAEATAQGAGERPELEVDRDIRTKVDALYYEAFTTTSNEVTKRWTYESEIKRPYFHVTELEHSQLSNWRKYLDFEETEGDYERTVCLYERCLVTCALYDEFWFRYARWMSAQSGREEEVRHIYVRAAYFVPISRPGIRLQWAYFEESCNRVDVALDIHSAILTVLPDCVEVINSWAQATRRQKGVDEAVQVYKDHIEAPTIELFTKAAIIAEWAMLLWRSKSSADEARAVFLKNVQWYADSRVFWDAWFQFELEQPSGGEKATEQAERMKDTFSELRSKSRLSVSVKQELARQYMSYLVERGGKDAMRTFLEVDREMFG